MGNMYFAKAYTDNLVTEVAIRTAAKCADPNLETIINSGNKVPDSTGSLKMSRTDIFSIQMSHSATVVLRKAKIQELI